MKKELFTEIEIPEGMNIEVDGSEISVSNDKGKLKTHTKGQ